MTIFWTPRAGLVSLMLCTAALITALPSAQAETAAPPSCAVELVVLGAGQDAGAPQIGYAADPAWQDPQQRLTGSALALIETGTGHRYLFDASPHLGDQLARLDRLDPSLSPTPRPNLGLSGIFLTHAHIGHYAGLMWLGREAAGTAGIPVHAMPRLQRFLETNGPWDQLVRLGNIRLVALSDRTPMRPSPQFSVTPYRVPHRDEYSETVGFLIETPQKRALYLPDIDSWTDWARDFDTRLEDLLPDLDLAFLDATFFDDDELPGRDMSLIPHPRVSDTMDLLQALPASVRQRVQFIHYNHTNPIRWPESDATRQVYERGYKIARAGDRHCLFEGN